MQPKHASQAFSAPRLPAASPAPLATIAHRSASCMICDRHTGIKQLPPRTRDQKEGAPKPQHQCRMFQDTIDTIKLALGAALRVERALCNATGPCGPIEPYTPSTQAPNQPVRDTRSACLLAAYAASHPHSLCQVLWLHQPVSATIDVAADGEQPALPGQQQGAEQGCRVHTASGSTQAGPQPPAQPDAPGVQQTTINRVRPQSTAYGQPIPPNNCPQQPQAPDHSTGRSKTKAGRSSCTSDMCDSKAHPRQAMNRYRLALLDRTPACLQTSASPVQQTQHCATDSHSVFGAARPAASRGQIPWRTCFEKRASTTHAGRLPESW
jgi:hypothetical protein